LFLTYLNHVRTRTSSTILLLFWPAYTLVNAVWTRTLVLEGLPTTDKAILGLKWTVVGLGLVTLVLECLGSETFDELATEDGRIENPVIIANTFEMQVTSSLCLQLC
jgi:ATP-binding cassette subfamily C (CFTR/MRP) protein 1